MTLLLLDTSAYSGISRANARLRQHVLEAESVCLSPIVLGELRAGFVHGSRRNENERILRQFLSAHRVKVLSVDSSTSEFYAEITNRLRTAGTPIPTNDIWIAASAMQHGATLLTTDAHFQRIPHILVEYVPLTPTE
jgi:predicted nucleic acid-binding protein